MATPSASPDDVAPRDVWPLRPEDPDQIGGHRLLGRLGSGGMGVVYLGRDPLGGLVAVKAAHAGDDEPRRRLAAEAACMRRAPDGCAARLLADGTARKTPYIVTEYVEGRSLADVVGRDGPLPPEQVQALAVGLGRTLATLHEAGLVHRDLKPANVLLTPTGPRLIDFGIAQEVDAGGGPTEPGMVVGSPGWIPPERLDRRPASPASDVFGWGCLVAYAGIGRNPFGEGDAEELARRVLHEPPDLTDLAGPVRALVERALAKDPALRPASADLVAQALGERPAESADLVGRLLGEKPAGSADPVARRPPARRRGLLWPLAAVVAAAALLAAVIAAAGGDRDLPDVPSPRPPSAGPVGNQGVTHGTGPARTPAARSSATRSPAARPRTGAPAPQASDHGRHKGRSKGKGRG